MNQSGKMEKVKGCEDNFQNTTLNPVILESLFQNCDVQELSNFRQVCKTWWTVSLQSWREKCTLHVTQNRSHDTNSMIRGITLDELKLLILFGDDNSLRLEDKPFEKISVNFWDFSKGRQNVDWFWNTCGAWLKELTLQSCIFQDIQILKDILYEKTPNLEKLILNVNEYRIKENDMRDDGVPLCMEASFQKNLKIVELNMLPNYKFPLKWLDFLRHFPYLYTIRLKLGFTYGNVIELLEGIQTMRQSSSSYLQLKHLDIIFIEHPTPLHFPEQGILLLQQLQLPLKTLKIDVGYETKDHVVKQIILPHATSLQTLHLYKAPFSPGYDNFPLNINLGYLTELRLYGTIAKDFSFLNFTPNLVTLHVFKTKLEDNLLLKATPLIKQGKKFQDVCCEMISSTQGMDEMVLPYLEELQGDFEVSTPQDMKTLGKWMPNDSLRWIELLAGSDVNDEAVTGIPLGRRLGSTQEEMRRPGNISDLQGLEGFCTLDSRWKPSPNCSHQLTQLSDRSVEYGFLHLNSLRSLHVYFWRQVNSTNMKALEYKVKDLNVKIIERCPCRRQ